MNVIPAIVMGFLGLGVGYLIPAFAERIAAYKYAKREELLVEKAFFAGLPLKIATSILNACGWAAVGLFLIAPLSAGLIAMLLTMACIIALVDLRIRLIPNEAVLLLSVFGFLFQISFFGVAGLPGAFISAFAVIVVFVVLAILMGFGSVGAGDVKLGGAMGLVLGYPGILNGLLSMSIFMVLYCVIGLLTKRITLKSAFPFAPFMMFGMILSLLGMVFGF